MTLSDADLEARLRNYGSRVDTVPPDPHDLVAAARDRYRRQRRFELKLAAAALASALVFLGVPLLSGMIAGRSVPARPAPVPPTSSATDSLFDQPTRGSLGGNEQWLAGVAALSWGTGDDPPVEIRHVAFADDITGGRVALVLARLDDDQEFLAWFTGPVRAAPSEMTLATEPSASTRQSPWAALWDQPDPAGPAVLVVVALPGDEIEVRIARTVTASGEIQEVWSPVPTRDGAAVAGVEPVLWNGARPPARVLRNGEEIGTRSFQHSDRLLLSPPHRPLLEDPLGLRHFVPEGQLQAAIDQLAGQFTDVATITLLAGGLIEGSSAGAVLVEAGFPSGGTIAYAASWSDPQHVPPPPPSVSSMLTPPSPADTADSDRVFALALPHALIISAPVEGALAEVRLADGTAVVTVPLMDGAGVASPLVGAKSVGILDQSGAEVASAPID